MKCYSGIDNYQTILSKYFQNPKVKIIRDDSVSYLSTLKDDIIDAIYIDADHSYEGCLRDLESAYRVVKKGGYIMGHDYKITNKCHHNHIFGVGQAVDEFCKKYNLSIYALGLDGCVSYTIIK
jgi:predicted O-methyltransferase YrrM